jgi:hypothetical protein
VSSIANCLVCQNLSACITCASPYLAVNGICFNCPIWPMQEIYYLNDNNTCSLCSNVTDYCIRCSNSSQCTQCLDLYYL